MVRMAARFAERLQQAGVDVPAQIRAAYRLAFNRPPSPQELRLLVDCATKYGLPSACRLIFNANEFVFID